MAEKNKGGRPQIELDALQIRDVELLAAFLPIAKIADYFGISEKTFRNLKKRDEAVFTAYKRGVAKAHAHAGNIIMKFMQYDGDDIAQLQLKFQAAKFYVQTKAGWGKEEKALKIDIPDAATPLDILNITTSKLVTEGLTLTEFKQLIEFAQTKQQLIDLQPKGEDVDNKYTVEECMEIAKTLLPAADILELQQENKMLKQKIEELAHA
jgi:DNA-binding CsgD family transcriptional regulator